MGIRDTGNGEVGKSYPRKTHKPKGPLSRRRDKRACDGARPFLPSICGR